MSPALILAAVTALGVDVGWQPVAGGGIEYIIQIEPEQLPSLKNGQDIFSDLPPGSNSVRSYRITVGNSPLPHQGEPLPDVPQNLPSETSPAATMETPALPQQLELPTFGPPATGAATPARVLPGPAAGLPAAAVLAEPPAIDLPASSGPAAPKPAPQVEPPSHQRIGYTPAPKSTADDPPVVDQSQTPSPSDELPPALPVEEVQRPWWPLTLTLLGLFVSMGGNIYLGWIAWGWRRMVQAASASSSSSYGSSSSSS